MEEERLTSSWNVCSSSSSSSGFADGGRFRQLVWTTYIHTQVSTSLGVGVLHFSRTRMESGGGKSERPVAVNDGQTAEREGC